MDDIDVTAIARGMEAHLKAALAPFKADAVTLSCEEAVLTLGLISAPVETLERDGGTQS